MTDDRPRCHHLVVYPMDNCVECIKAENAELRADLDRVTNGTWSKEIARVTAVNSALRAEVVEVIGNLISFYDYSYLDKGIGTDTPDGTAWLQARAFLARMEVKQ